MGKVGISLSLPGAWIREEDSVTVLSMGELLLQEKETSPLYVVVGEEVTEVGEGQGDGRGGGAVTLAPLHERSFAASAK